jgi:3-oxoacyl-[acyl-carrier protein] reductase
MESVGSARVAIITGAGRGIGRAMALGLAQAQTRVIATAARELAEVEAVAKEALQTCGEPRVIPMLADVTRDDDCARVVDAAIERFGRLDILVNNAARGMKYVSGEFLTKPALFWETDPETWRTIVDTNVNGPFLMTRRAVPVMLEAGWGRIVNISVSETTMRRRGFSPYGPSKAALESETIIWAQDLEGTGITVNALLPGGPTRTGMVPENMLDSEKYTFLDPSIMVAPLLWLVSAETNGFSGQRIVAKDWTGEPADAASAALKGLGE